VIPGISINSSTGVVTAANSLGIGTYRETVTVSNALGASAVRAITIQVIAASGETDTGLTFGANKYAWAADSDELDVTSAITMQAWVYQTSTNAGTWNMVMNKENSYQLGTFGSVWSFGMQGSGGWTGVQTGVSTRLNEWQHAALTRVAGSNQANFYLNGQLVWTGTADGVSTGNLTNSNQPFTISGRSSDGSTFTSPFVGTIDQVKVFRSARSQSELVADMHTYGPIDTANLALYYDFNEASGSVLINRASGSSSASDLSIVGAPSWVENVTTSTFQAYTVKTFTRSYLTSGGGWKVPTGINQVTTLVVAGGGAGGTRAGGGGGAGGLIFESVTSVIPTRFETVTVGAGGIGNLIIRGRNGGDSAFSNRIVATGGGSGGGAIGSDDAYRRGSDGGSGGGAAGYVSSSAAIGVGNRPIKSPLQGRDGGLALVGNAWPGGGGGGISGVGANGSFSTPTYLGGKGGDGLLDPISGTTTCFSTGGGGGVNAVEYTASAGNSGTCSGKGNSPNGGA
jgi:hypothetical protein